MLPTGAKKVQRVSYVDCGTTQRDFHFAYDFRVLCLESRSLIREIVNRLYFKILESILLTALKASGFIFD